LFHVRSKAAYAVRAVGIRRVDHAVEVITDFRQRVLRRLALKINAVGGPLPFGCQKTALFRAHVSRFCGLGPVRQKGRKATKRSNLAVVAPTGRDRTCKIQVRDFIAHG
jgi:hypothetical protein